LTGCPAISPVGYLTSIRSFALRTIGEAAALHPNLIRSFDMQGSPLQTKSRTTLVAGAALILALGLSPARTVAQQKGQQTYKSAEDASQALFNALNSDDKSKMLTVLGPDARKIVSSGDDVEDETTRSNFVTAYQEMHRLVAEPDGTTTLYIGAKNWPTPIPLVANKGGEWYFDTDAARKEILYRRIGQNEMAAIHVTQELTAAQKEYSAANGGAYAMKFVSDEGKHDGLYWLGANDQYASPIGPLIANAGSADGVSANLKSGPVPFHGYFFKILDAQGKDAEGGAQSYVADGKMNKGFAFVAYPAVYRDSGVMTFIVCQNGVVFEKDLGKKTDALVKAMAEFNPDSTWHKVDLNEAQSAANSEGATDVTGTPTGSAPGAAVTHTPQH
jgi:hypothetical protein